MRASPHNLLSIVSSTATLPCVALYEVDKSVCDPVCARPDIFVRAARLTSKFRELIFMLVGTFCSILASYRLTLAWDIL